MASLAEYLKKYTDGGGGGGGDVKERRKKKKGKKKGESASRVSQGLVLVDDDPTWHRKVDDDENEEDGGAGAEVDAPQVIEDVEVKRQKRLEERRRHRPYLSLGEDGSGWVSLDQASAAPRPQAGPPDRAARHDTPESDDGGSRGRGAGGQRRLRHDSPDDDDARGRGEAHPDRKGPGARGQPRAAAEDESSPPRRARGPAGEDLSPSRRRGPGGQDLSPPRRRRGEHDTARNEGAFPPGRQRSDEDTSPPRRQRRTRHDSEDEDASSPRRQRGARHHSEEEGTPPPRRQRRDEDTSPPRRQRRARHDSEDEDASPHRRQRGARDDSQDEQKRETDLSPPRRRGAAQGDLSPPRRRGAAQGDLSPPRRRGAAQEDLSPPRRPQSQAEQADLSPPRRARDGAAAGREPRRARWGEQAPGATEGLPAGAFGAAVAGKEDRGGPRMSDGSAAGLVSGRSIAEEMQAKRERDAARFALLQADVSGQGAQTVFRDKSGRKVSNLELIMAEEEERKKRQRKVLPPPEWGKGLAQKRQAEAQRAEQQALADRPFAAYEADAARDEMLRDRVRFGDPMAHLAAKKRKGGDPALAGLKDLGADEAMVESGFAIPQDVPPHSWLKRRIAPPLNRFGIRPGRHWDGVDRSNGFERDLARTQNERQARNEEAYKWSVADM